PRKDQSDVDVLGPQLLAERVRVRLHRVLAGGIGAPVRRDEATDEGGEVDDRAAGPGADEGECGGDGADQAEVVDAHQPLGDLDGAGIGGGEVELAGAVDEHVDPAFALADRVD